MALSNIFNEPRREITETAVGLGVLIIPTTLFGVTDYYISHLDTGPEPLTIKLLFNGVLIAAVLTISVGALIGALIFIHSVGESVCAKLQARGINLRPTRRH